MGQFINQPDFGTNAFPVVAGTTNVKNCALYMGSGGQYRGYANGFSRYSSHI